MSIKLTTRQKELLEQPFIKEYYEQIKKGEIKRTADEVMNDLKGLYAPIIQQALEAEMSNHLGYEKHDMRGNGSGNNRNGYSKKILKSSSGTTPINIPRDRKGDFIPEIVKKYETASNEVEEKIIGLYGMGNTTRDIQGFVKELYHIDISPTFVSQVTDKILPLVEEWQDRELESIYPFVFLDGIHFKVRDNNRIVSKCAYVVVAYNLAGQKEVLGVWVGHAEGAKFWMSVLTNLRNRGLMDILIMSADGLSGLPEAIQAVYPEAILQHCIVHKVRNTTKYVSSKDMKAFCGDLRAVYTASTEKKGLNELTQMKEKWPTYQKALESWNTNWATLAPFFEYPPQIRKIMYTTNLIESVNRQYRKVTKTTTIFPHDQSLLKLLYLATKNMEKRWTKVRSGWGQILLQLAVIFPEKIKI